MPVSGPVTTTYNPSKEREKYREIYAGYTGRLPGIQEFEAPGVPQTGIGTARGLYSGYDPAAYRGSRQIDITPTPTVSPQERIVTRTRLPSGQTLIQLGQSLGLNPEQIYEKLFGPRPAPAEREFRSLTEEEQLSDYQVFLQSELERRYMSQYPVKYSADISSMTGDPSAALKRGDVGDILRRSRLGEEQAYRYLPREKFASALSEAYAR